MAVLAQSEKNQIENRLAVIIQIRNAANLRFRLLHGKNFAAFGKDAMRLRRGHFQCQQQSHRGEFEITLFIRGRHHPFIAPKKVNIIKCPGRRFRRHRCIQQLGSPPARKRHGEGLAPCNRLEPSQSRFASEVFGAVERTQGVIHFAG